MSDKTFKPGVKCSFCGKDQDEIRTIITGPAVCICDECVDLCSEIIERDCDAEKGPGDPPVQADSLAAVAICLLCKLPKAIDELVPLPERGFICTTCVDAVRTAADAREKP